MSKCNSRAFCEACNGDDRFPHIGEVIKEEKLPATCYGCGKLKKGCNCKPTRGEVSALFDKQQGQSNMYTGGSSDYYKVEVKNTTSGGEPYMAECNDIIEALGMNFAEGNAFKALWRRAAHRTLGLKKAGAKDDGLYDAEKVKFFGERLVEQSKVAK